MLLSLPKDNDIVVRAPLSGDTRTIKISNDDENSELVSSEDRTPVSNAFTARLDSVDKAASSTKNAAGNPAFISFANVPNQQPVPIAIAKKKKNSSRNKDQKNKKTVEMIFAKAKAFEEAQQFDETAAGREVLLEDACAIANQANDNLPGIKFIGQYETVTKWIPRTSSVYADNIDEDESMLQKRGLDGEPITDDIPGSNHKSGPNASSQENQPDNTSYL